MTREGEASPSNKPAEESRKRQQRSGNDHSNKHEKYKRRKNNDYHEVTFTGGYEEMNGNVFECPEEGQVTLQYTNTTKELVRYVNKKFKFPDDIEYLINNLKNPVMDPPKTPSKSPRKNKLSMGKKRMYEKKIDKFLEREEGFKSNVKKLYNVIWSQCSKTMQTKVQATHGFEKMEKKKKVVKLLKKIKGIMYNFDENEYLPTSLNSAVMAIYQCYQGKNESNASYLARFRHHLETLKYYGGNIGKHHSTLVKEMKMDLVKYNPETHRPGNKKYEKYSEKAKNRVIAEIFLKNADKERYGKLIADVENDFIRHGIMYPADIEAVNSQMAAIKTGKEKKVPNNRKRKFHGRDDERVDNGETQRFMKEFTFTNMTCYRCQQPGHIAKYCPEKRKFKDSDEKEKDKPTPHQTNPTDKKKDLKTEKPKNEGVTATTLAREFGGANSDSEVEDVDEFGLGFHINGIESSRPSEIILANRNLIPDTWILLDSQSTVDIFRNKNLLKEVKKVDEGRGVRCFCNSGYQDTHEEGTLAGYGKVWYNDSFLANILSFAKVSDKYRITIDTKKEQAFIVHVGGFRMKFIRSDMGLYYHDTQWNHSKEESPGVIMIQTVANNMEGFTPREVRGARAAQKLHDIMGRPRYNNVKAMLQFNQIRNCPVTVADMENARKIYGPSIERMRGRNVREKTNRVEEETIIPIPREILEAVKELTMCCDLFFVDGTPFLLSITRKMCYTMVECIPNRKLHASILPSMERMISSYRRRGFVVTRVFTDVEFNGLREVLADRHKIKLNISSANEHVPEAEREIRFIKEGTRSDRLALPFEIIPKLLTVAVVKNIVFWANCQPRKQSISRVYSARVIMTEAMPDYSTRCKLQVGSYCEVQDDPTPTNSQKPRTVPALALEPAGNLQGGNRFLSLKSKQVITRYSWTEVPAPQHIIEDVQNIAKEEKKIGIKAPLPLLFEFTYRDKVIEDEIIPPVNEGAHHQDNPNSNDQDNNNAEPRSEAGAAQQQSPEREVRSEAPDMHARSEERTESEITQREPVAEKTKTRSGRYYFRNPTYSHLGREAEGYTALTIRKPSDGIGNRYGYATDILLLQMSAKRGIEAFGKRAEDALIKEYRQFSEKEVFIPILFEDLKPEERKKALSAISLIEEKRNGNVKGRTVADGSQQRSYIDKGDAASPTVTTEAVLITSAIEASERRVVVTCDISGAFLQAKMDDHVIVVFRNEAAEMLVRSDPRRYKKYLYVTRKGSKLLYVKLRKAMYGCMKAALLFWKDLSEFIVKEMGFELNKYDPCVANKEIEGSQCTITWHVDDLKISHANAEVVKDLVRKLESKYGKMSMTMGTKHKYVGMNLEFHNDGTLTIDMREYVEEALKDFPEAIKRSSSTPATSNLFQVDEKSKRLPEDKRVILHRITARLLFVTKRSRPDIQVAVGFLTTRVDEATEKDWTKLSRLMKYLHGTLEMILTLKIEDLTVVKWWVDVSYAMNSDYKSQTGSMMTLGAGSFYSKSSKQKINTKSSTEGELVGATDMSGQILWTLRFLKSQGYEVRRNILYQDNQSAMMLEKNGHMSSGQRTKHINVRYFFMKDRIDDGEIKVVYCPTDQMIGAYFTKPLQGKKFKEFRDFIMGLHLNPSKERVGGKVEEIQIGKESEF